MSERLLAVFALLAVASVSASFLNSVFGFCLGCEIYLLLTRVEVPPGPPSRPVRMDA